jgi:hypothetical protein
MKTSMIKIAAVLMLVFGGVTQLVGKNEAATAQVVASVASEEKSPDYEWRYFPDLFVNQGTERQETYIEQF